MSKILAVPHRHQLADGYCLPACAQMVLAYWGIERKQPNLARQLGMVSRAGTPGSRIHRLASTTLDVIYRNGNLADLNIALSQGVPPIMLVYTSELPYWSVAAAHAVVLLGIENDRAVLNDPGAHQTAIRVSLDDLLLAWDEMDNLYASLKLKKGSVSDT